MMRREKLLGWGVGVTAALLAVLFLFSRINVAFETRNEQLIELDKERMQKERAVQAGVRASGKLEQLRAFSLPGDESLAVSLYSQWLLKKAVESGFSSPNVTPGQRRSRVDVYDQLSFIVDAQGDLQEVSRFLHEFYQVGYLHRIARLSLTPVAGKKDLKVFMTIEALSVKGAENRPELAPPRDPEFADRPLDPFLDAIVGRNFFSAGNNPPKFAAISSPRGNPNRSLSFTIKATDADPLDAVTYSLEGPVPEGAKLDPKSGEFRWTPPQTGVYEVAVRATDDGLPSRSAVEKVKIEVTDPPPPVAETPAPRKLDFDPAQHAFLSAILQTNGKWQIWVLVRTEGKMLRLEEGDRISVGSVNGTVKSIRRNEAEFGLEDGGSLVVHLGRTLATEG